MPIVSLQSAGSQVVAKAGVNYFGTTGTLLANSANNFPLNGLATPGLPSLTWIVTQTAGAGGCTVQPQVALRRGDLQGGVAAPAWINLGSPSLLVPLVSTVFEFNAPVEFMRFQITTPNNTAICQVALLASG